MTRTAALSEIRFGAGLSPNAPGSVDPQRIVLGLLAPDLAAKRFPVRSFAYWRERTRAYADIRDTEDRRALRAFRRRRLVTAQSDFRASLSRLAYGPSGFRERLTLFWANHFTTAGRRTYVFAAPSYIDEAIRPNLTGSFADLLRAATLHPLMLDYLDQSRSVGPNSPLGLKRGRGVNENLAREMLELHTLGSTGGYDQDDVEALALLLTGATFSAEEGFVFRRDIAEPGEVIILGRRYGGGSPRLKSIVDALDDLARHPDTARHVATKLVTHFVSDVPDPALVAHVARRFEATGGDLISVYAALLEHPAAWTPSLHKVRPPFDYMAAGLRALAVTPERFDDLASRQVSNLFHKPLARMGQPFLDPPDPAGWPEPAADWITPQGLAARIQWSMQAPRALGLETDPRDLVESALGPFADDDLRGAVAGADTRVAGIGLVLASPAFNRR